MEVRPKIKLKLSTADKIIESLGYLSIIALWSLTIMSYKNLPEIIPTHFNESGQADEFGDKRTILTLPAVATILFAGMTILNKFPHILNYLTKITEETALFHYTNAARMIRYLKLITVIIFGIIVFKTIQNAHGHAEGLGIWFLPIVLGLIIIPLIYFIFRSLKTEH